MESYWDRNWVWILICIVIVVVALLGGVKIFTSPVVELNLVAANSYMSGDPEGWEFKINGKEFPGGIKVKMVKEELLIQVIELPSGKSIDELDISSFIKKGDVIAYAYYGATDCQGESLNILIQHKNGTSREIKVNIDNQ